MVLDIVKYPSGILRQKSLEVCEFDENLHKFLDDMYDTLVSSDGVGLAAIQVGVAKRILLVRLPREDGEKYKEDLIEVINPTFLKQEGEILWNEGCLSVPEYYEETKRYENLTLAYQDRFGNNKVLQASGFLAVAFQHEIDHLNGVLFIDRLPILKRKKFEKELKRRGRE